MRKVNKFKIKKKIQAMKGEIKLNLGCGTDYKKGWINVDNNSDNNIKKLDLNHDLLKQLPFADNSVSFIFHEHFLEHLSPEESEVFLNECMRVLKRGGVMRIAMPDLESIAKNYVNLPLAKDPVIKGRRIKDIKTKAEWINISFRAWGHKWLYDFEELTRRFDDLGYKNIERKKHGQSKHKTLQRLETREESLLIAEVTK